MSGLTKTKKHNQNSPQTKKVHREFNFLLFQSEIWQQSVICLLLRMVESWKKPSLLSLLDPILGKGGQAGGSWVNELLAIWQLVSIRALSILPNSRPTWHCQRWVNRAESTEERTRMWLQ